MNNEKGKWDAEDYAKNSLAQESWANELISLIVETYTKKNPVDSQGRTHVKMVRLEVEASPL